MISFDRLRQPVKESDRRPGPFPYYGASGVVDHVDRYLFDGEYLLVAEDGENLRTRQTPIAFMATGKFWVNNHAHVIQANATADTRYLMYALQVAEVAAYLTGSTMPKLTAGNLTRIPVPRRSRNEQRAIASVLGALDDKIDLNRKMSATLEAMARALFKSWFVDFDPVRAKAEGRDPGLPPEIAALFPDAFEDSELGEIPKGWTLMRVGSIASLDKGLSYKGQHLARDGMPMLNLACFKGNGIFEERLAKGYLGEYKERHIVKDGDLMLANTDITQKRIVLGSPGIVRGDSLEGYLFTHHVFAVRLLSEQGSLRDFLYHTFLRENFRDRVMGYATGTTVLALPRDAVLGYKFPLAPQGILDSFRSLTGVLGSRQRAAAKESATLAVLRDTLLPRLISGEIRVTDAERVVGQPA